MKNQLLPVHSVPPVIVMVGALIAQLGSLPAALAGLSVIDLSALSGANLVPYGINNSGQVVGYFGGVAGTQRAFLYSDGLLIDMNALLGANSSTARSINDLTQVVGYWDGPEAGPEKAFLYAEGIPVDFAPELSPYAPYIGSCCHKATAINNAGQIAGTLEVEIEVNDWVSQGFLYDQGTVTLLGALVLPYSLNDFGEVVGSMRYQSNGYEHAFISDGGTPHDLGTLGGLASSANDINNRGDVVGFWSPDSQTFRAFLHSHGTTTDLGMYKGYSTAATSINDLGQIVGYYGAKFSPGRAFLYARGVFTDLNDLLPPGSGWVLQRAVAINNKGQIVGTGTHNGQGNRAFLFTPGVRGIDVSSFNDSIDWTAVKESGKNFAYIRATQGKTGPNDKNTDTNVQGAQESELAVGVYHLAYPKTNSPIDEANNFLSRAARYIGDGYLPPVLDLEDNRQLDKQALSQWVRTWLEYVEGCTQVRPIIYTIHDVARKYLDSDLAAYPLWITTYPTSPDAPPTFPEADPGEIGPWTTWAFQQYSTNGSCAGIKGAVDLDSFNGDVAALQAMTVHPVTVKLRGTGFGPLQPPSKGQFQLQISAPGKEQVTVQGSEDMVNWTDIDTIPITTGTGIFLDTSAGVRERRFYRPKP